MSMMPIPLPSSAITNVIAGIEAAQTATSAVLAIQSSAFPAFLMVGSAVLTLASALLFGSAAGALATAELTVAIRSTDAGYDKSEERSLRDQVRSVAAPHVGRSWLIALTAAVAGIALLMWATSIRSGS